MDGLNAEMRRDPDFWSCSVVHDRAFFEALELPGQRKSFVPTCSYEQYHQEMARCDVAFLPLRDTPFNWMKSISRRLKLVATVLLCWRAMCCMKKPWLMVKQRLCSRTSLVYNSI